MGPQRPVASFRSKGKERTQRGPLRPRPTAWLYSTARSHLPRTRGAISASLEGSPPRPSTAPHVSASLEATPRRKGQTAIRSPVRRTEALNANNSAAAPGSDGVRPPLRTVAVTGVLSTNSGHCSAIPGAVAPRGNLRHGARHAQRCTSHCAANSPSFPRTFLSAEPSNGMATTLGRGPSLDQIKTPACRTLGTPPHQAQGTVPSTGATMPPTGAARTPA